ncbi:MAG TPA: two-component regulator propeller domain-containing protein, partial [Steroidobacteraceae bacterium]|nr:two-component regulator propeller domain-containing protein [Steroidobacteraceae bacterium]
MHRISALLLAGMGLCALAARAAAPVPAVRPMYFQHLTMRDGLSDGTVNAILQDSQGYLWLGTESGLDRYDGYGMRVYRRDGADAHSLPSDYVWTVAEDAHHDLWLATIGGGVVRWQRSTDSFQRFAHDAVRADSLAGDEVRTLVVDGERIWAGTLGHGLDLLDPASGSARHFRHLGGDPHSLASDDVYALYKDRAGRLWVGTDAGLSL